VTNRAPIRLDSWKEIADYLGRDVRTAIRWETERGMPVRRVPGQKGHGVFALREEIDAWLNSGPPQIADAPTVAVLPFFNASEPEKEYVSDGISESIINTLSRTPRVRVMAWSTVRRYRGPEADPCQVGRKLSVGAVLAGRLLRRNSFWQISAELVDPADGAQLWGKQYARPVLDLQTLPHEICSDILAGLGVQLKTQEKRRLVPRLASNPQAFDLLLQARFQINQLNASGFQKALEYLEQAVQLEPDYAEAYAEMAHCYMFLGIGYGDLPPKELFAKADWAARKAIEVDDSLGEAHAALAVASPYRGFDWPYVEKELQRAIELSPGFPNAHVFYGTILSALGRFDEAIEELRWAAELDPLSPLITGDFAFHLAMAGRQDEAEEQIRKTLQITPECAAILFYVRAVIEDCRGLHSQAVETLEQSIPENVSHTIPLGFLGYLYARNLQPDKARGVLARLDELAAQRPVSHFSKAIVYAGLREIDTALACLERAFEEQTPFLYFLKTYPWFDSLRGEPRFQALVCRVGLPD
jgi:TolB-like protein/Tfp pilus assembly protein PilF